MENRIKEQFSLFADRVSAETIRANQLRLYLSAVAYILVSGLRRVGLKGTEPAQARVSTIRTKLLKVGAQIRVSVRKVWVSMASSHPWQGLYRQVWRTCAAEKPTAADNLQVVFSRKRPARTGAPKLPRNRQQSPHKPQEAPATAMHSPNRPSLFFGRSKKRDREPTSPHFYRLSYLVYRFNNIYPY
jgi:hypothetical protein